MNLDWLTYDAIKYSEISGRYLPYKRLESFLEKTDFNFEKSIIGHSVNGLPIHLLKVGNGDHKVFMWSQMHGNESTTTKAVLDLLSFLNTKSDYSQQILDACTLYIIPMLNPDGATAYTRFNANNEDLNRDSKHLTQPESRVLRAAFENIEPDFCFNLHDQRTIFNVGDTPKPATLSFLAPSEDPDRNVTDTRKKAMEIINAMVATLQNYIPNQIGRFDDSFNINCIGDMFTSLGVPTILFEAGHYQGDYEREETRKFVFIALLSSLLKVSTEEITGDEFENYFDVPENEKRFFDILIKNFKFSEEDVETENEIGVLFKENLQNNNIFLFPYVEKIGNLQNCYGHQEIDASNAKISITRKQLLTTDLQEFLKNL
ncbi:Zinc carboxypeptidase [Pustulibacterium marinum]|uniref:Zinc carboxypeptidase n=1 Tax=Pustulibacterium marinum TaxID=1224947 RepID=A0A1I7IGA7_9FLAO|nr:M14 metallopeptidase family protein [Pustulibacterium marinum]SFU71942.1 Zinc carboxypeptidase [Pustulibacterium marinum]